jgi:hypothetical protein
MNNHKQKLISIVVVVFLTLLLAIPVIIQAANYQPTPIAVDLDPYGPTEASVEGLNTMPDHNTFYAVGRHWIMWDDNDGNIIFSSSADGNAWTGVQAVATTGLYGFEMAVWYDLASNTIHYARHDMDTTPDEVKYRMGTPNANGTITWAAAEQTVATTPADLVTWRTTIAVDEEGYPWVAWVDTDGVNSYGIVYVEASTTKNGTWTQNVTASTTFTNADYFVWFVSLTPVDDDKQISVGWSREDITGGITDGEMSLESCMFDDDTGWDAVDEVVPSGDMNAARPDAFSFYDHGSAMWCAYTDVDGDVAIQCRSMIETWIEGDFAIIKSAAIDYYPTISGYKMHPSGLGENLICIVHSNVDAYYSIYTFGSDVDDWGAWTHIWTVPDMANDLISRHVASYNNNMTTGTRVGFAWQYHDDTVDTDTVYYWWIDNTNNQLGYYPDPAPGNTAGILILSGLSKLVLAGLIIFGILKSKSIVIGGTIVLIGVILMALTDALLGIF